MITLIYGDNNYQAQQQLQKLISEFNDTNSIERYDGDELTLDGFSGIATNLSLFSSRRLAVIRGASDNKELWASMYQYLDNIPEETHIVLHEQTLDKRTKTYKELLKKATIIETKQPSEAEAVSWLVERAKNQTIALQPSHAQLVITRVGLNQWQLHHALEKLAVLKEITSERIQDIIEPTAQANAFLLIDAALGKDSSKVREIVRDLRVSEDAYFFFGLLSSQLFQLITLSVSQKSPHIVAKDLGVHPYPLQKMHNLALRLNQAQRQAIATILANCDTHLKRSSVEPWEAIELALLKLTHH